MIVQGVQYPYAMTVFQQDIFWTDWTERAVFRAGKDDGSDLAVLVQELQYRPNDIHVFAASKQESCYSSCQQFNGGCSHICVPGKTHSLIIYMFPSGLINSYIPSISLQVLWALSASVLIRGTGTWPIMAKTVSKTLGNAARQSSSPVSMVTASLHAGSVTAMMTAGTTRMSWRECVVRDEDFYQYVVTILVTGFDPFNPFMLLT